MKRLALLLALVLLLSACSAGATPPPPESILYLGGAATLAEFHVEGGPGDPDGAADILIRTPTELEEECFHFAVIGTTADGAQKTLFTEADVVPASYLTIGEEVYGGYVTLTLFLDYTWNETLMSMRTVNLLTLEEESSVSAEFDLVD